MSKGKYVISAVGMPVDQREALEAEMNEPNSDKHVWIVDKPVSSVDIVDYSSYNPEDIVQFNQVGKRRDEVLFNYGYNEEDKHTYCDLYDHGIFRVYRDNDKKIIGIDLICDGIYTKLREEKNEDI